MTKKLSLLFILSAVLFLSSCLDSGKQSIIGTDEPSYIVEGNMGIVYARTQRGFLITSPKINTLTPGRIALLSYQITEESKEIMVEEKIVAYEVEISREPITLDQTILNLEPAPDVPAVKFESLKEPLFAHNEYFGDRWIFTYYANLKKGEIANVRFYKASDEDAKTANSDVLIDVRLEKVGEPSEGAASKIEGDNIVVDMSSIRTMMSEKADEKGDISIKVRYYTMDNNKAYTTITPYKIRIDKE